MNVYRIEGDPDFIGANPGDMEQHDLLSLADLKGVLPDLDLCIKKNFYFREPEAEGVVTDCPYMSENSGLLLSARAVKVLRPLLDEAGVVLQVTPELDMRYRLFVCMRRIDALDMDKTELCDQELYMPWDIRRYAFKPEPIEGKGFFKVKGLWNRLFATDRVIEAMAGHRLSGFRIRKVWSRETGPTATFEEGSGAEFIRFPPGFGTTVREKRQAMREYIAGPR